VWLHRVRLTKVAPIILTGVELLRHSELRLGRVCAAEYSRQSDTTVRHDKRNASSPSSHG
jgi:hypothetical protein